MTKMYLEQRDEDRVLLADVLQSYYACQHLRIRFPDVENHSLEQYDEDRDLLSEMRALVYGEGW